MAKKITVLKLCLKIVDRCCINFIDEEGNSVGRRDDYVPDYFPEEHYGDYVEFDVDVATGQILNWKKPTQKELKDSINEE